MNPDRAKILCVEDDADILDYVGDFLERLGFSVLKAPHADQAWKYLEEQGDEIVLVVSDYAMPRVTGAGLRKKMLNRFGHIPFVMLSGYHEHTMNLEDTEHTISHFARKPLNPDELAKVIHRQIALYYKAGGDQ